MGGGAVFWCWITGVFGIATCYAEAFLSSKYRVKQKDGKYTGGPMYVLKNVLHMKHLAAAFALFTVLASFGVGSSVQANSICTAITEHCAISPHIIGIVIAVLAGVVMLGGVKQISKICTYLVPFMSIFYLAGCSYLLLINRNYVVKSIWVIVTSAFSCRPFIGGIAGTAVIVGIRTGISKGLFTNEAGLGSIPMTSAVSNCNLPSRQGLISMTGPFWDTVIICAVTGIVVVSSMLHYPLNMQISLLTDCALPPFPNFLSGVGKFSLFRLSCLLLPLLSVGVTTANAVYVFSPATVAPKSIKSFILYLYIWVPLCLYGLYGDYLIY